MPDIAHVLISMAAAKQGERCGMWIASVYMQMHSHMHVCTHVNTP